VQAILARMLAKSLPALLLLALPALAAPNRPPPDNSYCATNRTGAMVEVSFRIWPSGGDSVTRDLTVEPAQTICTVGPAGRVSLTATDPRIYRFCRIERDAAAGQMRLELRVGSRQTMNHLQQLLTTPTCEL